MSTQRSIVCPAAHGAPRSGDDRSGIGRDRPLYKMGPVHARRHAFTLIELVVVISIMVGLAAASVPGIVSATRRAALGTATTKMATVIAEAQRLARAKTPPLGPLANAAHYGVALVTDSGAPYITLLHGISATDELLVDRDGDGTDDAPALRVTLPSSVEVDIMPSAGRIAWFFAYGNGRPIASPAVQTAINVGDPGAAAKTWVTTLGSDWSSYRLFESTRPAIPASPVCTALHLRTRGAQFGYAVTQYTSGLLAISEIQ